MAAPPFALRGVYTALVTPFTPDGSAVDWPAYEALLERQIAGGVAGVVPCGTTGESPTLSLEEKQRAIETAVRLTRGRGVAVVAGTGTNDTAETVALTRWARGAGADACLVVNPYYNRPSQAGLKAHVAAVAAVGLPVLLYNIPGRSGVALSPGTVAELAAATPGLCGIKDATGGLEHAMETAALGCALPLLSGDDALTLGFIAYGGVGVVSVVSNLAPRAVVEFVDAALRGDAAAARAAHARLYGLFKGAFVETNPVPAKFALAAAGLCAPAVRLPLVELAPASRAAWEAALRAYGWPAAAAEAAPPAAARP